MMNQFSDFFKDKKKFANKIKNDTLQIKSDFQNSFRHFKYQILDIKKNNKIQIPSKRAVMGEAPNSMFNFEI